MDSKPHFRHHLEPQGVRWSQTWNDTVHLCFLRYLYSLSCSTDWLIHSLIHIFTYSSICFGLSTTRYIHYTQRERERISGHQYTQSQRLNDSRCRECSKLSLSQVFGLHLFARFHYLEASKLILTHIICLNPNSFTGSFTISLAGKTQIPEHLQGRDVLQDLKRHFRYGSMAHAEEVW